MDAIILTKNDWVECDGCGEKIPPVFWNRTFNKETKTYSNDETMESVSYTHLTLPTKRIV